MEKFLLWFLYLISFVIVIAVQIAYSRLKLSDKIKNIRHISGSIRKVETDEQARAYGEKFRDDLLAEYKREYSGWSYAVPTTFVVVIMATGNFFLFLRFLPFLRFEASQSFFESIPASLLVGYLGGYFYVLYSLFKKYHLSDLNPVAYFYFSIQLPLAGTLGYLVSIPLESSYDLIFSFTIGTLPVPQLMNFLRGYAEDKLGVKHPAKETFSNLYQIQGMSKSQIDRLAEEDILRLQNLAFCNPLRLYLLTNYRIKLIIDWVDQALLIIYVNDDDRLNNLRGIGIRCVTELKTCKNYIAEGKKPDLEKKLIEILNLGNKDTLSRLLDDIDNDPHIKFIWEAWDVVG